ncbi:helix-turn-helix domain-containing protein [Stackebrandtia nassauensis]|nr:helix-turn-helix transcriptional regulator [Stackebrandtia nassauensis]
MTDHLQLAKPGGHMARTSRSLRARWLGSKLRKLRLAAGLTLADAADAIHRDPASLSRFESGASPIRSNLLLGLIDHYGLNDFDQRNEILELCDDVANHGWWDPFKTFLTAEFADFLWVEERATAISLVDVVLIHGLFQTPDYAHALINDDPSLDDKLAVRRLTELRIARQRILTRNQAPQVTSILHEAALYHRVGDRKVMRVQLDHLIAQADNPNIDLRLLPLGTWIHGLGSVGTGLAKYQMPTPYPTVGYTENVSGLVCHMDDEEMDRIERMYAQMESQALTRDATMRKIKSIAKEI